MTTSSNIVPLRVSGLAKRYATGNGVSDVHLSVAAQSITGFIGVNGAGKSTTLKCVLGLATPDAGEIHLFGAPASRASRRRIGFLPEERGMFPRERARDVIAFHGRLKGLAKRDAFLAADRLLERVGLADRRRARIEELSKGNAQRVQMLCALAHAPSLLILDEPLTGLDPVGQSETLGLFSEFRAGGGAILFSTHAMAAAEAICDKVVMLAQGRTVFEGPLDEASSLAPHGAILVTTDLDGLRAASDRLGASLALLSTGLNGSARWRVVLPAQVSHPALIRALAEQAVSLQAFEPIKADLTGAFWQVAAPTIAKAA